MEVNEANVVSLVNYLNQTLSPDVNLRRPAEKFLESVEGNQNYPVLLLNLIDKQEVEMVTRVAGAIIFKNYVKRNWKPADEAVDKISLADRNTIKGLIVGLMLKSPEMIQKQLSDAVSIVGREDFPQKWPNLLNEMVNYMQTSGGDFRVINGVLQTAHSLFKRYRHEFKSQELWTEIKYVLDNFAKAFTELFVETVRLAQTHANNPQALKVIFASLVLCTKIFNSLNAQELPEFFEDNMSTWMQHFLDLLSVSNTLLMTDTDDEAGLLEQLKSQICDNIGMYAQKYSEEFEHYLPGFVQSVWTLLTTTGQEPKHDLLVSNAIRFLSTVADRLQYKKLFEGPGILSSLCSKVIIPNMEFRPSDEEMFEDNPEEYIRRDIEGSDIDTRRRAACDLVKSLSRFFEAEITAVFSQYIQTMLSNFANNPKEQWKSKDAAIYLVTSMAVKGSTARLGTTHTSELVDVIEFYHKFVREDLERSEDLNELPVLRADALKYIMTFRQQLPVDTVIIPILPRLVQHLDAQSVVIHTYAAHTIERLFTLRDSSKDNAPSIVVKDVQSFAGPLVGKLFAVLNKPGSSENEYVMKAIMRTLSLLQEQMLPFLEEILPKLTSKLGEVAKNPSKPHFNHFLFESLCLSIRIACQRNPKAVNAFEGVLFPIFQEILVQDVQEFIPYVFQIMSLLLAVHEEPTIPEAYMQILPCLLAPLLWDRPANIKPLVRLLQAFIRKSSPQIAALGKVAGILGVFQKLIASRNNDHEGFYLLESLIQHMEPQSLANYMKQIFVLLFTRLTTSKTTKYIKCLLVFFSLFAAKYGGIAFLEMVDSIQPLMFGMVVERLFVPEVQKVSGACERKICAIGMTAILCDVPALIEGPYSKYWAPLLQALVGLFELPQDETIPDDEHFVDVEDTPGYQAGYSQLVFVGAKKEVDPILAAVSDARLHLARSLQTLSAKYPGKLTSIISTGLAPEASTHLTNYITAANVSIA